MKKLKLIITLLLLQAATASFAEVTTRNYFSVSFANFSGKYAYNTYTDKDGNTVNLTLDINANTNIPVCVYFDYDYDDSKREYSYYDVYYTTDGTDPATSESRSVITSKDNSWRSDHLVQNLPICSTLKFCSAYDTNNVKELTPNAKKVSTLKELIAFCSWFEGIGETMNDTNQFGFIDIDKWNFYYDDGCYGYDYNQYTADETVALAPASSQGLRSVTRFTTQSGDKYVVVTDNEDAVCNYIDTTAYTGCTLNLLTDAKGNTIYQKKYSQNNWALLKVSDEIYKLFEDGNGEYVDHYITSITGTIADAMNTTINATSVTVDNETVCEAATPNTYTPTNFMFEKTYEGNDCEYGEWRYYDFDISGLTPTFKVNNVDKKAFFMLPKRCEFATITWSVPDATYTGNTAKVYMPEASYINTQLKGGVTVNWEYNNAGAITLNPGKVYKINGVILEQATYYDFTRAYEWCAPKRRLSEKTDDVTAHTTGGVSTYMTFYPINVTKSENLVITSVEQVQGSRQVQSVTYYDLTGRQSAEPFAGANVVVTRYSDGSTVTSKLLK